MLVDAADMGSAAHRVRLFWSNMLQLAVLQATLPHMLTPSPPLSRILKEHHIPTMPDHTARRPFATHNIRGGNRICMPTVVSYPRSNAYRPKDDGAPGEGELFNTYTNVWEEPNVDEKELLLGYSRGDTAALGVSDAERSLRLGKNWMPIQCVGWVPHFMPARHRDPSPPRMSR